MAWEARGAEARQEWRREKSRCSDLLTARLAGGRRSRKASGGSRPEAGGDRPRLTRGQGSLRMGAVSSRARESWRRWRAKVWIFLGGDVERHPGPGQEAQAAARRCALRIVREQYDDMWAGLRRAYGASMVRIEEHAILEGEQRWESHLEGEQLWAAGLRDELRRIVNIRAGLPSRRAWRTIETAEVARLAGQQEAEEEEQRERRRPGAQQRHDRLAARQPLPVVASKEVSWDEWRIDR